MPAGAKHKHGDSKQAHPDLPIFSRGIQCPGAPGRDFDSYFQDGKTYVFLSFTQQIGIPTKPGSGDLKQKIESLMTFYLERANRDSMAEDVNHKMEGHMTFYLESKYQDSRSEVENQKMESHTTFHLERKFKLSQQM